ncbi:hypothetical protein HMPREF9531_01322, partial [Escherichia coli MS 45-1]
FFFFLCLLSVRFRRKSILNKTAKRRTIMKPSSSNSRSKGHAKARRKTREELDQEARDRKRQKKRRGHAPGSRAAGGNTTSGSKGQNAPKDPRIGSKTPIPLGVAEKVTKQHKPKSEKPMLSPQAELELLETDERLDALLERLEAGETLSAEEQSWVDAKLDRIDELMQKLGLSYDDDEEEEEDEKQEDMMRLLRGN